LALAGWRGRDAHAAKASSPIAAPFETRQAILLGQAATSIAARDLILNSLCVFIIEHYVTTKLAIEKRVPDAGCPTVCRKLHCVTAAPTNKLAPSRMTKNDVTINTRRNFTRAARDRCNACRARILDAFRSSSNNS